MFFLSLVADISTAGRSMLLALRMRVSMSAMGSVIMGKFLRVSGPRYPAAAPRRPEPRALSMSPAGLADAGDEAVAGHVAEADPADAELAVHGPRPAAQLAAHLDADLLAR